LTKKKSKAEGRELKEPSEKKITRFSLGTYPFFQK
ncbi:unnamed protein product, partial [marine sediment metagenome]